MKIWNPDWATATVTVASADGPVADCPVTLTGNAGGVYNATTDADGKIVFDEIEDDTYTVSIVYGGYNVYSGTLTVDQNIFDMKVEDLNKVVDLNLYGTVYPCLVFGEIMAQQKSGAIVNVSSMAAYESLTRVPGYSMAKSAVENFTRWLAQEMAIKFSEKIRVNAIAPGFFIGNQNRAVLINPDGSLTERSQKVIAKTPMRRFGDISELNGAVQFLCSDAASFITGATLAIDGGFSAFSGV